MLEKEEYIKWCLDHHLDPKSEKVEDLYIETIAEKSYENICKEENKRKLFSAICEFFGEKNMEKLYDNNLFTFFVNNGLLDFMTMLAATYANKEQKGE